MRTRLADRAFPRRQFLCMSAGGALLASCASTSRTSWRFFTSPQARIVEAVCERLIPADRDPGATQAGVVDYIDLQLSGSLRRHQGAYREGIAALNEYSRSRSGCEFADLAEGRQTALLAEFETREPSFFNLILSHAMQGFYGDPRHGGNRDEASWRMLGLTFPPIRGRMRNPDQETG